MTVEEAIRVLREVELYQTGIKGKVEACEMAISALRAQQEGEKNETLTLDELRDMDGQPVWCCSPYITTDGHWAIVRNATFDVPENNYCVYAVGIMWYFSEYGETWIAYRRPPESK